MLTLQYLFSASLHIDYPMLFELRNDSAERVSHCGVLEFIAEEGMIYMPYWVFSVHTILIMITRMLTTFSLIYSPNS